MKRFLVCGLFLLLLAIPATTLAVTPTAANVVVPSGDIINDNFVRVGQSIEVNGDVHGDVIAAGQSVTINGAVSGDVIAAAATIRIHGAVSGNIRVAGDDIQIDSAIGKNATVFGNTIELTKNANIGWSLQAFSSSIDLDGVVGNKVNYYGASAIVRGSIHGDARFNLGEKGSLRLAPTAVLGSNLSYQTNTEALLDQGATVHGTVEHKQPTVSEAHLKSAFGSLIAFSHLIGFFGLLVVGLLFLALFPKTSERVRSQLQRSPARSLGWGFVLLIIVPIIGLILLFTIIGLHIAGIGLLLYGLSLYLVQIFVGLFVGTWVVGLFRKDKPFPQLWAFVIGIALFSIVTMIPFIGWVIGFLATVWAFGAFVIVLRENIRLTEKA